jgi:hypothetical protein
VEDELIRRYLPSIAQKPFGKIMNSGMRAKGKIAKAAFGLAQKNAQTLAFKQRRGVLRSDLWLDEALSFAGETI